MGLVPPRLAEENPDSRTHRALARLGRIRLTLPDSKETPPWGKPHVRVGEKICFGFGGEKAKLVLGFKLEMEHADEVVEDPRFARAGHVGHRGWLPMDVARIGDWNEAAMLVSESHRPIAPSRSLTKVGAKFPSGRRP